MKNSIDVDPATAMIRRYKKSSRAYDTATRTKDAWPKHSDIVKEKGRGVTHRGMGRVRGRRSISLSEDFNCAMLGNFVPVRVLVLALAAVTVVAFLAPDVTVALKRF